MEYEDNEIVTDHKGKVCTIRINRPDKANSLTPEMLMELKNQLINAQKHKKTRIIILTGTGNNFTTGMDVNTLREYDREQSAQITSTMERLGAETVRIVLNGKPVICAINGRAMGMGVVYALASDFRFAVNDATFKMPEIEASIYPAANCITLMTQQLGPMKTKEILMTCKKYNAQDFKNLGILNGIVGETELIPYCIDLAKQLSRKNFQVLRFLKKNINSIPFIDSFQDATDLEHDCFLATFEKDKGQYMNELVAKYNLEPEPE